MQGKELFDLLLIGNDKVAIFYGLKALINKNYFYCRTALKHDMTAFRTNFLMLSLSLFYLLFLLWKVNLLWKMLCLYLHFFAINLKITLISVSFFISKPCSSISWPQFPLAKCYCRIQFSSTNSDPTTHATEHARQPNLKGRQHWFININDWFCCSPDFNTP